MSTFNSEDHPRGHANNKGSFSDKPHSDPEARLTQTTAPRPPVPGWVQFERWDAHDLPEVVGASDPFDVGQVLDTYPIDQVREFLASGSGGQDDIYDRAQALGLAESHDGPFTVQLDDEHLAGYIAAREAAGQDGALAPRTTPAAAQAKVDRELADIAEIQRAAEARLGDLGAAGAQAYVLQRFPSAAALIMENANDSGGSPYFLAIRIEDTDGKALWTRSLPVTADDSVIVEDLARYTPLLDRNLGSLECLRDSYENDPEWRLAFNS